MIAATLLACASVTSPPPPEAFPLPVAAGAETPSLAVDGDLLWLAWQERVGEGGRVRLSRHVEGRWTEAATVAEGDQVLVNWADHAAVHPDGRGGAYVHWLERQASGSEGYDVRLAHTVDGVMFRALGAPYADTTAAEHGFVSVAADGPGHRLFWVDGRGAPGGGPATVRTAPISPEGVGAEEVLDDRACDCCATDAVATPAGPLVAYRDRSEAEVRDVVLARPGAGIVAKPGTEAWTIDGCPVNGPALDGSGDTVALAWFTSAGGEPRVRASLSVDGGRTFGPATDLGVPADGVSPMGRVDAAVGADGAAVVSWMQRRGELAEVVVRRLTPEGPGPTRVIGTTSSARGSGFPALVAWRGAYVVVYATPGEPDPRLAATRFDGATLR